MKKLSVLFCAMMFFLCTGGVVNATTIFEDDFNSENGGVGILDYNGFANWTVVDGTVDLIGNGYFDFQPGYGLYVDMDGSTGNAGKMFHTFISLDPGDYILEFDLAGNHRNTAPESVAVEVSLGLFSETFSLTINDPFTTFTRGFTITSSDNYELSFEGAGGDNIGMLLDNVKVSSSAPVPEPATMLLVGAGLLGLAGFRRKFKK